MKKRLLCLLGACLMLLASCGPAASGQWYDFSLADYLQVGPYLGLSYNQTAPEPVTDASVEEEIRAVLQEHSSRETLTAGTYQLGDELKMDFEGRLDGEPVRSSKGYRAILGGEGFFAAFTGGLGQLVGQEIASTHTLRLSYPADHADPQWAGKTLEFVLTVHSVERPHVAQLTDDFVKTVSDCTTVEQYRTQIRTQLSDRAREDALHKDVLQVWSQVLESSLVKRYPSAEVEGYCQYFQSLYAKQAAQAGLEVEDFLLLYYGITLDQIREDAKRIVKQDMVMYTVAREQNITFTPQEYTAHAQKLAREQGLEDVGALESRYSVAYVEKSLLLSKVQSYLLENAKPQLAPAPSQSAGK